MIGFQLKRVAEIKVCKSESGLSGWFGSCNYCLKVNVCLVVHEDQDLTAKTIASDGFKCGWDAFPCSCDLLLRTPG